MTVTTWTLTGDVSDLAGDDWPTTGATGAEAYLTAYDADGPVRYYVDSSTGGKVRFGPTIPLTLTSDGTFTRAGIPDSSETGLSYALTLTYRPTGHGRSVATTTDRFTLDADKALNQVGFQDPTISPAVVLANATDAVVSGLVTDLASLTRISIQAATITGPEGPTGPAGVSNGAETVVALGDVSGAVTLDFSLGSVFTMTLVGNLTGMTLSNFPAGKASTIVVVVKQDGTGGRNWTSPAGVKWTQGGAPLLSTGANRTDIVHFFTPDGGTTVFGGMIGWNYS